MQKPNNHKSVAPIPPPLNQRFRRGLLGGELKEIFDEYADPDKDPSFHKTCIPVKLMQHEGESLLSRSQAKRLISRFDRFTEVVLDFEGVTQIGQAFADQVFRVFINKCPSVHLKTRNAEPDVKNMIKRVQSTQ